MPLLEVKIELKRGLFTIMRGMCMLMLCGSDISVFVLVRGGRMGRSLLIPKRPNLVFYYTLANTLDIATLELLLNSVAVHDLGWNVNGGPRALAPRQPRLTRDTEVHRALQPKGPYAVPDRHAHG
jgi:hypothetical protein